MNKIFSGSFLIVLTAAFLFSCTKDVSKIGVEVVGGNPLEVTYMDTVTIKIHSELIDSLRSDELSSNVIGAIKDPIFGMTNASVYSQFVITNEYEESPFIGPNPTLDSIVLYIRQADTAIYGDPSYSHHLSVYEIGEEIWRDSTYYAFDNARIKNELLGEISFVPTFDTVEYITKPANPFLTDPDTLKLRRPIRINLSDVLGEKLLNNPDMYKTLADFVKGFNGIYITTLGQNLPSSGGATINTIFDSPKTFIGLYYHNDTSFYENDEGETVYYNHEFTYYANNTAARFSNFNHYDYQDADADFYSQVIEGNEDFPNQKIYMQGLGGVKTTVQFTYLHQMDDYYNYAINEAKLILTNADSESSLKVIPALTLSHAVTVNEKTANFLVVDATSGPQYFGGTYLADDERYIFRITQHLQQLIEGNTDDNIIDLEIIGGAIHPYRFVGYG
ncbi:MAG: DUF4270 family protein, partial [Bacteroidales bacterium]|nr:DUF4270 family protein [Bacteroidales bacterium]